MFKRFHTRRMYSGTETIRAFRLLYINVSSQMCMSVMLCAPLYYVCICIHVPLHISDGGFWRDVPPFLSLKNPSSFPKKKKKKVHLYPVKLLPGYRFTYLTVNVSLGDAFAYFCYYQTWGINVSLYCVLMYSCAGVVNIKCSLSVKQYVLTIIGIIMAKQFNCYRNIAMNSWYSLLIWKHLVALWVMLLEKPFTLGHV